MTAALGAGRELGEQARLADPRLAGHRDGDGAPAAEDRERAVEPAELAGASDEAAPDGSPRLARA